jgi:hypothetical protein
MNESQEFENSERDRAEFFKVRSLKNRKTHSDPIRFFVVFR